MDKAPDAFRTISEVADELDVPQHVLRFWESRFPQIKPMKRGGGRRYYRPDDVDLLRGIRHCFTARATRSAACSASCASRDRSSFKPCGSRARRSRRTAAGRRDAGSRRAIGAGRRRADAVRSVEGAVRDATPKTIRTAGAPEFAAAPAAPPAPYLTRDNVRRLQSALHELRECRRLIDLALKDEAA